MEQHLLGRYGEVIASRYLRKNGYSIATAQYKCRVGEIDIIAEDKKYICFVEVKTRSEGMKYAPADAVDSAKRQKIISASKIFLKNYKQKRQPRFDIVEVYFDGDSPIKINHIENAFDYYGN